MAIRLRFHRGTLVVDHPEGTTREPLGVLTDSPALVQYDARDDVFRGEAKAYRDVVRRLVRANLGFVDEARGYDEWTPRVSHAHAPRDYQRAAVDAWKARGARGVVVLPTGAGKSLVALMALQEQRRTALVIAPTLDLVRQWHELLERTFEEPVGLLGGGSHTVLPLTVSTYDSAHLHIEHLGHRFGLLVFDECHHLPSPSYAHAARGAIAPFRLGLTATPERTDGAEASLVDLVGPEVYRRDIVEFAGSHLAPYDTERILLSLDEEERAEYTECRALYRAFVTKQGIQMGSPQGFQEFVMRAARSEEGVAAHRAFRRQRELAFRARAKFAKVEELLAKHRGEKIVIFTNDNATVYDLSRRLLVPVITHRTPVRERSAILQGFRGERFDVVATSRVLNEGVDLPEASVAIVLSGTSTVREHVQRLGRVLRKGQGKRAVLYELVSESTTEEMTSTRRRAHSAYR